MKYDVFISYSSLDQKVAEGVCAYLEQHRIRCFIAYRDIPKGVVWARAIVDALDESRMMVVVFSGNFNSSEQVDREIELASEDKKPILTFRIADEAFKGAKKYYLKNRNWMDAFPQPERYFGSLCENVRKLLGMEEAGELPKPEDKPAEKPKVRKELEMPLEGGPTDARRQYELGLCYEQGNGVAKNMEDAAYWYGKAARQGHVKAQYRLGKYWDLKQPAEGEDYDRFKKEALNWYKKAAEQGDADAQFAVGSYYYGWFGAQSYNTAIPWLRKAEAQGHMGAACYLGDCYRWGRGVARDWGQAASHYRKAAEAGNPYAQKTLGDFYRWGWGVQKNLKEAVYWYRKALPHDSSVRERLKEMGEPC